MDETPTAGDPGHLTDHAALKAEYDSRGAPQGVIAALTALSIPAQHLAVHNTLHADYNASGDAETTLPTNPTNGHLTHHQYLARRYNAPAHTVTIAAGSSTATIDAAITALAVRSDTDTRYTLQFQAGTYDLTGVLGDRDQPLINVHITSVNRDATSVTLNKGPSWGADEYLFEVGYGYDIEISYLTFQGNHVWDPLDTTVHWTDQGIYYASCHDTQTHHCRFIDIGNAAVRHNTRLSDPVTGVNSWSHYVEDCTFSNCWQVTTTQDNSTTRGGSRDWWFQRNSMTNQRGSIKFATRTAGAYGGHILDNTWSTQSGGDNSWAIELSSVYDVEIRRNTLSNLAIGFINAYTNDAATSHFEWGDDIIIDDNDVTTSGSGVRISPAPYPDAYSPTPHRLQIINNSFTTITHATNSVCRIGVGTIDDIDVNNNAFASVTSSSPWDFAGCTNFTYTGNTLDASAYPPPPPTANLRFNAASISGLADGTAINGNWTASIGTSTASQATSGKRPTKQTVSAATVVRFDGTDDSLSLNGDALTFSQNKSGLSIFAKVKLAAVPNPGYVFAVSTPTSTTSRAVVRASAGAWEGGGRRLDADASLQVVGSTTPTTTATAVISVMLDYANSDAFVYVNGSAAGSTTSFQTSGSTSNTASAVAYFGASVADGNFAAFDLYDVRIYTSLLTSLQRQAVEADMV